MDHVQFYRNKEQTLKYYLTLFEGQTLSKTDILNMSDHKTWSKKKLLHSQYIKLYKIILNFVLFICTGHLNQAKR